MLVFESTFYSVKCTKHVTLEDVRNMLWQFSLMDLCYFCLDKPSWPLNFLLTNFKFVRTNLNYSCYRLRKLQKILMRLQKNFQMLIWQDKTIIPTLHQTSIFLMIKQVYVWSSDSHPLLSEAWGLMGQPLKSSFAKATYEGFCIMESHPKSMI